MRRVPESGPALLFKPEDEVVFKHAHRENGIEVLSGVLEITNNSSKTVSFRFGDDPEFKFTPHRSLVPSRSTAVVLATFYNVDGHCQPRRSSIGLRCIRVRSDDPEDVERLWKKTPSALVGEKRWRFRFEKNSPDNLAHEETAPLAGGPSLDEKAKGFDCDKWAAGDAGTDRPSLPSPKIQTLCFVRGSWPLLLVKFFAAAIVLAALYLMLLPANPRLAEPDMSECVTLWGNAYCF